MSTGKHVGRFAVENRKKIAASIVGATLLMVVLAVLPSIWPRTFSPLNPLTIDTDPENMLPADAPVRVFHDRLKRIMSLNDMIVIGIVDPAMPPEGVFTPAALEKIFALSQFAQGLRWRIPENPFEREGVVEVDMIAPSMVDNVESGGAGVVRFEWLMAKPPETPEEALAVRRKALDIPFLAGTLVSEDGQAVALYLPISVKDVSHRIYQTLQEKLATPSRLFPSEIGRLDPVLRALAAASRKEGDGLVNRLWQMLDSDTRRKVLAAAEQIAPWQDLLARGENQAGPPPAALKAEAIRRFQARRAAVKAFLADINAWMQEPPEGPWRQPGPEMRKRLDAEGRRLLAKPKAQMSPLEQQRLKRLWVEAAFPGDILPARVAALKDGLDYHIAGLPVAEDTFGVQMFKQMALSAPLAMAIIFALMWLFFRSTVLILPAMYDALIATAATMSLLVITGSTVHIMSSMIPIFIVPIAVLDDVHVISEFFDRYRPERGRRETLVALMGDLFTPMLYTTLTTAVGFASLALAPIPPVQVFGLFVAFGVIVAWLCSILLVPAFISVLPRKTLDGLASRHSAGNGRPRSPIDRLLRATGRGTYRYAKPITALGLAALALSAYGIGQIRVNDNPTKWFESGHPIRVADKVLNNHFGGTYMAYLAFRPQEAPALPGLPESAAQAFGAAPGRKSSTQPALPGGMPGSPPTSGEARQDTADTGGPALPAGLEGGAEENAAQGPALPAGLGSPSPKTPPATSRETDTADQGAAAKPEIFKEPTTLRWIGALQDYLAEDLGDLVGKSNAVTDIVKTVHRELMVGVERGGRVITEAEAMRIPDSRGGVAQSLLQFQNSHRPQDLWHFVTPDYRTAVVWLQLKSGDNRDMRRVVDKVADWIAFWRAANAEAVALVEGQPERFRPVLLSVAAFVAGTGDEREALAETIAEAPAAAASDLKTRMAPLAPSVALQHDWFGLTYINVVWQEKMVVGMLKALLGSFLAVFLMMTLLYRSALWGLLCMAPLTVTIATIYGLIGFVGKDYDMPVAVLSSLSLGLAVDYAIHFLTRSRMMYGDHGSWQKTAGPVFGEPARAIFRNAVVVGIGFLPLLLAPLVPYQTVGIFIAAILLLAGLASLLILPAVMTLLEKLLFPRTRRICTLCHRGTCIAASVTAAGLVLINVRQFLTIGWSTLTWFSLPAVLVLAGICAWMSRGERTTTEHFAPDDT